MSRIWRPSRSRLGPLAVAAVLGVLVGAGGLVLALWAGETVPAALLTVGAAFGGTVSLVLTAIAVLRQPEGH